MGRHVVLLLVLLPMARSKLHLPAPASPVIHGLCPTVSFLYTTRSCRRLGLSLATRADAVHMVDLRLLYRRPVLADVWRRAAVGPACQEIVACLGDTDPVDGPFNLVSALMVEDRPQVIRPAWPGGRLIIRRCCIKRYTSRILSMFRKRKTIFLKYS
jgi:hypothetical protein